MISIFLLAPAPAGEGTSQGGGIMSFLPLILIFVVFYFFMIRPQTKKAKELKKFRESLKKGDKVVTVGGVHGVIEGIQDATIKLKVSENVIITIEKSAISHNNEIIEKKQD